MSLNLWSSTICAVRHLTKIKCLFSNFQCFIYVFIWACAEDAVAVKCLPQEVNKSRITDWQKTRLIKTSFLTNCRVFLLWPNSWQSVKHIKIQTRVLVRDLFRVECSISVFWFGSGRLDVFLSLCSHFLFNKVEKLISAITDAVTQMESLW